MKKEEYSNDGTIRFICGDCSEFMSSLKDGEFDVNISDPPYGIGEDGAKNVTRTGGMATATNYKAYSSGDTSAPDKSVFDEIIRTSKNQILWGANHYASKVPYDSSCWVVWDKNNGDNDFADCELAWTSFKSAVRMFKWTWNGMLQQNMKNKQVRLHPNEKPIQLYRWLLATYTKPTDTILDCYGGSMSHAIAAHTEGRKLTIIENDEYYFDKAVKRFKEYESQLTLF